jgi:hypothetical protein
VHQVGDWLSLLGLFTPVLWSSFLSGKFSCELKVYCSWNIQGIEVGGELNEPLYFLSNYYMPVYFFFHAPPTPPQSKQKHNEPLNTSEWPMWSCCKEKVLQNIWNPWSWNHLIEMLKAVLSSVDLNQSISGVSGTSRCLFSDKYKIHKYSVSRMYDS